MQRSSAGIPQRARGRAAWGAMATSGPCRRRAHLGAPPHGRCSSWTLHPRLLDAREGLIQPKPMHRRDTGLRADQALLGGTEGPHRSSQVKGGRSRLTQSCSSDGRYLKDWSHWHGRDRRASAACGLTRQAARTLAARLQDQPGHDVGKKRATADAVTPAAARIPMSTTAAGSPSSKTADYPQTAGAAPTPCLLAADNHRREGPSTHRHEGHLPWTDPSLGLKKEDFFFCCK